MYFLFVAYFAKLTYALCIDSKGFSFTSWSRPLKRTCYLVLECNLS